MESRKNGIDNPICKGGIETQTYRKNVWLPRWERSGVGGQEIRIDLYTLLKSMHRIDN